MRSSEMTGRERLLNVLNRKPIDRVAWTTLVDDKTRSVMPQHAREMPVLDFYRQVGCDILQFGNYGLGVGTMVVTYRNCPNTAPLALWWEVNRWWTPLLPRRVNGVAGRYHRPAAKGGRPESRGLDALSA